MSALILFITADDLAPQRLSALLAASDHSVIHGGRGERPPLDPPPDLVLIDTHLQGTDAVSLLGDLWRRPGERPPVLVLADRDKAELAVAAIRAGAEDVVFKPVDPLGLIARVEGLLARRALLEARENAKTLEFRNQELESFIYIVTHDMKTPVVNLQGLVDLVEQDHGEQLPTAVKDLLARLRRNADRLAELLRDLVEYPRRLRVLGPLEPRDTGRIAAAAVDGLMETARAAGVEVIQATGLPTLRCDERRLQQVFHNLVENAIKHSHGCPSPRVEIGWTKSADGPCFHVRDNGPGIPREHLQDVFRLFHRVPGTTVEGSGIGLAIARQLVEAHGGEIWCESAVGEGTTFSFRLGA